MAITASGTARVAVAGVWQDDLLEPGKRQRHICTSGDALATLLRPPGKGLTANPALQVTALGQQPIYLDCPALENDGQLPQMPGRVSCRRASMPQRGARSCPRAMPGMLCWCWPSPRRP